MANTNNWVKEETALQWRKTANKHANDRKHYENEMKKQGKKKIYLPHSVSPRCLIEKWI